VEPNNLRDSLVMVIGNDGQLVSDKAVAPLDNEVSGLGLEPLALFALQQIDETDRLVIRANPDRYIRGAVAIAARPRIDCPQRATPGTGKVAARAGARVGLSSVQQALYKLFVALFELALKANRTIPFKAIGFQSVDDASVGPGLFTGWIDILDTQQPFTLVNARLQIAGDSGQ